MSVIGTVASGEVVGNTGGGATAGALRIRIAAPSVSRSSPGVTGVTR